MDATARATGTGKYERLLERCKGLTPAPTAVAYPCEGERVNRRSRSGAGGTDHADACRSSEEDRSDSEIRRYWISATSKSLMSANSVDAAKRPSHWFAKAAPKS